MILLARNYSALILVLFTITKGAQSQLSAERSDEFSAVTYNVENLFDIDGSAMFDDYAQNSQTDLFGYSRYKLLTKLETIASVLKVVNDGSGPELIFFQELEADLSPNNSIVDIDDFLENYGHITLSEMLGEAWQEVYADFPVELWLAKALAERGMIGYNVAIAPSRGFESKIAHTNAIFSQFPLKEVHLHPLSQARDIIEAEILVNGHTLIAFVNHWKSGASNPKREPIRVKNAEVLRNLIDARLSTDPKADIIVAGDLNSHYNHYVLYPDIMTGINGVLRSSGCESFIENDLYNLWYELPALKRYAEVWRGHIGTLMHMILSSGLYDNRGISYVDNSFRQIILPGINADAIGRPLKWHFTGKTGGGASDHFPIYARFTTKPFEKKGAFSKGNDTLDYEPTLNVADYSGILSFPNGLFLNKLNEIELAEHVAQLFEVEAKILSIRPLRIKVGDRTWPAYYADKSLIREGGLIDLVGAGECRLIVQPNFYKGSSQLVIEAILED